MDQMTRKQMTMLKALHPRNNLDDYTCQEKKGEKDFPALEIKWMHHNQCKDSKGACKSKEKIGIAVRKRTDSIMIKRTTTKQKWDKNNSKDILHEKKRNLTRKFMEMVTERKLCA